MALARWPASQVASWPRSALRAALKPNRYERLDDVRAECIERLGAGRHEVLGGGVHGVAGVPEVLVVEFDAIVEELAEPFLMKPVPLRMNSYVAPRRTRWLVNVESSLSRAMKFC